MRIDVFEDDGSITKELKQSSTIVGCVTCEKNQTLFGFSKRSDFPVYTE